MIERLQKYMASCGIASRRKCEELILNGFVSVNGQKITKLGTTIDTDKDIVEYKDKKITIEEDKVYLALNKPKGYVTTNKDERGRKTILDLVKVNQRIFPIGRLDYQSSGLLLLTNDGDIYNKIIHPRVKIIKKYIVIVEGQFTPSELIRFKEGIDIGGYVTAPSEIRVIEIKNRNSKVEISITEGKNRQIRRMCDELNHKVIELKRVSVGEIRLGNLEEGKYRNLTNEELEYLKNL